MTSDSTRPKDSQDVVVFINALLDVPHRPSVVLRWCAVAQGDSPNQPYGEFEGSRAAAIEWALSLNPNDVLVFDLDSRDFKSIVGTDPS